MIRIINEIDNKKYELIPNNSEDCSECAFANLDAYECDDVDMFCGERLCLKYKGVWKEVKDDKDHK
jgi:hypothetical protein